MATYAIGDVQGCFTTLRALLARLAFSPSRDRIWLVGDLVNRGPRSLEVLRWALDAGASVTTVLGNHELHLLGRAYGATDKREGDTLEEVLTAPDAPELFSWLRSMPFAYVEEDRLLVHAGLLPSWTVGDALRLAREAGASLAGPDPAGFLLAVRKARWAQPATPALAAKVFTRIRTCGPGGEPLIDFRGAPEKAPAGTVPWFEVEGRRSADRTVIFGHWAALGFRRGERFLALDSGCVWGGALTAVRLEDGAVFQEPCRDELDPSSASARWNRRTGIS